MLAGCVLGALIELLLLRPLRGADIDTTMLVMIGAWIVMQNAEQLVLGAASRKSINNPFPEAPLVLGPVFGSWNRLFVFFVALRADRRHLSSRSIAPSSAKRCARPSRTATPPR